MNVTLKTLTAALALVGAVGTASAASNDGVSNTGGRGTGTGAGDLIFAYEGSNGLSILWDLSVGNNDLTFNDMKLGVAQPFSITNEAVGSFINSNPGGRWNILSITNIGTGSGTGFRWTQGGVGVTVNGQPNFTASNSTGSQMETFVANHGSWITAANNGGFPNNGTLTAGLSDPWQFSAGAGHSSTLGGQNAAGPLNMTLGFYSILVDPDKPRGLQATSATYRGSPVVATKLGDFTFMFDDATDTATLSYAPVPLPPAALLFGSALAGLVGLKRRSR